MTIYVDITQLEKSRANTGIQRVVKEFLKRVSISQNVTCKIFIFNADNKQAQMLDNDEVSEFLNDIQNYQFKTQEAFDLMSLKPSSPTAFFDIDSNWNVILKREDLYPLLKQNGFLIFNFIYDLIPILLPEFAHETTAKNFTSFIKAVYNHSDLVMFDSHSAKNDFLEIQKKENNIREIPTRVIGLGSDFLKVEIQQQEKNIQNILDKKYILFVGTLEPRKNQADVLEAFETIASKYPDLNLVFIGKKGWKVESLIRKIVNHPLKNKQLYWLDNIDDNTLKQFYKNAFLVTYLSKYEGYGLPIAESLSYGNITITSKNSSMYEVGRDAADYVVYNSLNELISLITLYCDNDELYKAKKEFIKKVFKTTSWEQFYQSIEDVFTNYDKSLLFKQNHLSKLQFVFISIDKYNLEGTIKAIDKHVNFVKEYIIVTQAKLIKEFETIETSNKLTIIDENTILKEYKKGFSERDHQSKNWLLRASLLNIDMLEDEFIMLDDDNRPLKDITIDKFISKEGSYNAYYFNTLLDWHHSHTEYDKGQQNMKSILTAQNYELLSYSSHCPQIINKSILKEAVEKFFDIGLVTAIDEWSTYFNYAASVYPCVFNKKIYETLSWPGNPRNWETKFNPEEITFENYYKELYDIGFFTKENSYEDKVEIKKKQLAPFLKSKKIFVQNTEILSKNNMVHTTAKYQFKDVELYLSNIPYFVVVEQDSDVKLKFNYKLLNSKLKNIDVSIVMFLDGNYRTLQQISQTDNSSYKESLVEVVVTSQNLPENIYDLSFNIMINNEYIYKETSPYRMKLIVIKDKNVLEVLGNPTILKEKENNVQKTSLKSKIKALPLIGSLARWGYTLLRLNTQQRRIDNLEKIVNEQQNQIQTLSTKYEKLASDVSKQISFQSVSFQQRMDQFIFDAKIDSKNEKL